MSPSPVRPSMGRRPRSLYSTRRCRWRWGPGGAESLSVTFNPEAPNGLKVARLLLATSDPAAPVLSLPLQARREILTIEGSLTTAIGTVITEGGSSTGEITLTNQNPASVNLTSVTISGTNAADFSVSPALPVTIESGASAVLTATFAPTGARGLRTALLEVATTDTGSPTLSFPVRARFSYGPPLLAHYKMDDLSGTSLADASGNASPARLRSARRLSSSVNRRSSPVGRARRSV